MTSTGSSSTSVIFACPVPLEQWLNEESKRRGISKSRLIVTILLEHFGLDIDVRKPGRPTDN